MGTCKDKQRESSNHKKRILLVDDNRLVGNLVFEILEHFGYQVDFKTDPMEALDHFQRKRSSFDLVITDMYMPIMTGDRLALEIVKIRKNIPIVMCTGSSISFSKEKVAQMGLKAVIMKPVIGNELK
ncbi:MAG: response regulator, partial [Nitrospina sp.]|nr:response regulator [Nitrospina sp.]